MSTVNDIGQSEGVHKGCGGTVCVRYVPGTQDAMYQCDTCGATKRLTPEVAPREIELDDAGYAGGF